MNKHQNKVLAAEIAENHLSQQSATFRSMEDYRRAEQADIQTAIQSDDATLERLRLVGTYGENNVWNTSELQRDFEVTDFMAPFCAVIRKSDLRKGSVLFQHSPRFYFDFMPVQ